MKRIVMIIILLFCLLLSGCSFLKKQDPEISFSIPKKYSVTVNGDKTEYKFVHQKTVALENGYYEVYCRRVDESTMQTDMIRYLFAPDGSMIGERTYDEAGGYQDGIDIFDATYASYIASIEDEIDYIEDDRIYRTDGSYEDLELEGDRIVSVESYTKDKQKILEENWNELGLLESLTIYDDNEEPYIKIRYTYQTVGLED